VLRFLVTIAVGIALVLLLIKLRAGQKLQADQDDTSREEIRYRTPADMGMRSATESPYVPTGPSKDADDLTRINGVGPVFRDRLQAAGFRTFAQVAASDPETLRTVVAAADWQKVEPERWIQEAAQFAAGG
jgi:predicted flap endonuclease-1-like 5' DNA nuclease